MVTAVQLSCRQDTTDLPSLASSGSLNDGALVKRALGQLGLGQWGHKAHPTPGIAMSVRLLVRDKLFRAIDVCMYQEDQGPES